MVQQGLTIEEAKKKIEYYCAYQERCHKEVVEKLKSLGMFDTAIDHIVHHLLEQNFLNEERFAKAFARGKHKFKFWGKRRIEQELKFRDISSYNIKTAIKEIEDDYLENFYHLADRKWETIHEKALEKKKKKWIDYLIRKGYETNLIFEALKNYD